MYDNHTCLHNNIKSYSINNNNKKKKKIYNSHMNCRRGQLPGVQREYVNC